MRQTLWQLQSTLNSVPGAGRLVSVDSDFLSLNMDAGASIDVVEFENVANALVDVEGYRLTEGQAKNLRYAIDLYRAHFLEGWYEDWCLRERERFQNLFLSMLDKLSAYRESRQEYEMAIHCCNRALRIEYVRECTHRQLMRLHYLSGDRTAALRQFDLCTTALADALDIAPSHLTLQLYEYICQDNSPAIQQPGQRAPGSRDDDNSTWPTIIDQIAELKLLLEGIQQQVSERLGRI